MQSSSATSMDAVLEVLSKPPTDRSEEDIGQCWGYYNQWMTSISGLLHNCTTMELACYIRTLHYTDTCIISAPNFELLIFHMFC